MLGETDGPPKVKKLLSCRERQGGLFTSSSSKAGICGGKINKTRYKHIPQMNRIIGAEQAYGRHLCASRQAVELVTYILKRLQKLKIISSEEVSRTNT